MAAAGSGVTNNVYPPGMFWKVSLTSGEEAFASMSAHVGLLRALLAKEGWSPPLADCLREVCQFAPSSCSLLCSFAVPAFSPFVYGSVMQSFVLNSVCVLVCRRVRTYH